jgi:hypothetical protein
MPRPARTQALPRPRVLLAATLLPLLGLWLARPAHAMDALGDAALSEVEAAGWSGLPLSNGDLAVASLVASPVTPPATASSRPTARPPRCSSSAPAWPCRPNWPTPSG